VFLLADSGQHGGAHIITVNNISVCSLVQQSPHHLQQPASSSRINAAEQRSALEICVLATKRLEASSANPGFVLIFFCSNDVEIKQMMLQCTVSYQFYSIIFSDKILFFGS